MRSGQQSFTDVEYGNRRRTSRREQFLAAMDAAIPWPEWVRLIEPHYYCGFKGRKPKPLETMLRMYLLQAWFSLSDEGVEDAVYDSYAMRKFMGLDFAVDQVPDATTLLHFRTCWRTTSWAGRCSTRRTRSSRLRAGSCAGAASWTPRSSPRRPRRRTLPVRATPRCTRRRKATSGTSG
jgi:hypothetical protein